MEGKEKLLGHPIHPILILTFRAACYRDANDSRDGERHNLKAPEKRAACNLEVALVAHMHLKILVGMKVNFQRPGGNNADGKTENENPC
jgi:hypothetical protein